MSQNTSHAVMQQRSEPIHSLDDFPTPPWATRALIEHVIGPRWPIGLTCWEPACNRGYMAKPLAEYFKEVRTSDVRRYGWEGQQEIADFLTTEPGSYRPDWIITNPPFRLATQFALHMEKQYPCHGYAILVRTSFLMGADRYRTLFEETPPQVIAQFVERVPMVRGRYDPAATTATSYAWLVWSTPHTGPPRFVWIPPCRKQLQKEADA